MYKFVHKNIGSDSFSIDYSLSPLLFKPNVVDCSVNFINNCFGSNCSSTMRYSLRSSGVSTFLV